MSWQCIKLVVSPQSEEEISELLMEAGALAVTSKAADNSEIFEVEGAADESWGLISLTGLFEQGMELGPVLEDLAIQTGSEPQLSLLEDQDWERTWLDQFKPLQIAENLWICPSWISPPESEATNIRIDPGMSFGTGTHESTRLCLAWLAQLDLQGKTVLDYGCGSGILAIAALKLGSRQAWATDIEPRSLAATLENARNNDVVSHLQVFLPDQAPGEIAADVVVANILAKTLIELKPILMRHLAPQGWLLLAGILREQADDVIAAFPNMDWQLQCDGEWVALLGVGRICPV